MAKTYDATLKQLVDAAADAWGLFLCQRLGLPPECKAEPLDADLSTVSPQADKLFRLSDPPGGYLHLELESSWSGALADRALIYNVLAKDRYGGTVRSVIVLLRKSANSTNLSGILNLEDEAGEYLRFRYHVVKLWELPCEPLLKGPLGTLPLGLLTDDAQPHLQAHIHQVDERLQKEAASVKITSQVWTACQLLLGLRYDEEIIERFFEGVRDMEESSTYQMILRKGEVKERRRVVQELGAERFGFPKPEIERTIASITDPDRLERMRRRLLKAADWDDLLGTP